MNLFVVLFLCFIDIPLIWLYTRAIKDKIDCPNINFISILFLPTLISLVFSLILPDKLSFLYTVYIGLCHIIIFTLCLAIKSNYIRSLQTDINFIPNNKKYIILCVFTILYLLSLYKQLSNAATILNESLLTVFINRGQALEEHFMMSGWALLFRLCTPLALVFELLRIKTNKNWLFFFVLFFIATSFLGFKKTEPIVGALSVVYLNYFYKRIDVKRIISVCCVIAILPFFITILNFTQSQSTFTELVSETFTKLLGYFSYQHPAVSKILEGYTVSPENNFQFIGGVLNKILGGVDTVVTRGDFVVLDSGRTTNVYSYWGSYFTQFGWFGIIAAPLYIFLLFVIILRFKNKLLVSLFFANLTLCFFGNMFQFLIFYVQCFYIQLISLLIITKSK